MRTMSKLTIALGVASALALGTDAASAAPVLSNTAAVKASAPSQTTEVRWVGRGGWGWRGGGWRGGGWGWGGAAAGLAAGAIIGSAIAAPYYGGYGYPYGYGYYDPGYAYGPAPVYAAPYGYYGDGYGWRGRRCYTNEGYGRYRACDSGY